MKTHASMLLVGLAACSTGCGADAPQLSATVGTSKPESPQLAPGETTTTTATATPQATSRASASPVASAAPPELRQPQIASAFLPHEATCSVDADCAATRFGVGPRFTCCDPCESAAGTRAWVKRADAKCEAMHRANQVGICPPRDCASLGARCLSGQCVPAVP